jgi:hypothetical protein
VVACVTVNDAFVAQAWAESAHAGGKARRAPLRNMSKPAGPRGGQKADMDMAMV